MTQHNRGLFITIEGIDGCGKTSLAKALVNRLNERGVPSMYTRQPGGCNNQFSSTIRTLVLKTYMSPMSELLLFLAERNQTITDVITPSILSGKIVICDRFNHSSIAYQGYGRRQNIDSIKQLIVHSGCDIHIDLTILIDTDPIVCRNRIDSLDRIESEPDKEFIYRVRDGFIELAMQHQSAITLVKGDKTQEEVLEESLQLLHKRFLN